MEYKRLYMATRKKKAKKSNQVAVLRHSGNDTYLGVRDGHNEPPILEQAEEYNGHDLEYFADVNKAYQFTTEEDAEAFAKLHPVATFVVDVVEVETEEQEA